MTLVSMLFRKFRVGHVERQLEMPPATIRNTGLGLDLTVVHSATAEE